MRSITLCLLLTFFSYLPSSSALDKITIDGKKHVCKGEIAIENNTVICDGTVMQNLSPKWWLSAEETVCGNEQVVTHPKGGGMKSVRADVHKGAFLDKDVVVCGTSVVRASVKVLGTSKLSGAVRVFGNSEITDSTLSGASEVHSSKLRNVTMTGACTARASQIFDATILGASKVVQGKISGKTTLSGAVEISNSKIVSSEIQGSSFIYSNSLIQNSSLRGSMKVQHGKINGCRLLGTAQFINQTCMNDKYKF